MKEDAAAEQHIEENYEVTLSTYDQSGSKLLSTATMTTTSAAATSDEALVHIPFDLWISATIYLSRFELDEEMYIACAIVNESLYDKNADKKKMVRIHVLDMFSLSPSWPRMRSTSISFSIIVFNSFNKNGFASRVKKKSMVVSSRVIWTVSKNIFPIFFSNVSSICKMQM